MMQNDKVALVTGGSRGIGRAIVGGLVRAGWQVLFSYHTNHAAAQEVVAELGPACVAVQADIARQADRERLVNTALDTFGGIDLLVNNAGMAPRQRVDILEMSEASYHEVLATNLDGPLFLTQQVARMMVEEMLTTQNTETGPAQKRLMKAIIFIGSISAYASSTNRAEYCVAKAGVSMLTALFADRLAAWGVNVYEVRPGIIATDMTAAAKEKYDRLIMEGLLPIQRWGTPEDVANAVTALASGILPYSTGEVINVDGGFHLRRL